MIFLNIHGEQMCCSWFETPATMYIYHAYSFTVFLLDEKYENT